MTNLLLTLLIFINFSAKAQISDPVKWKAQIEKKSDSEYYLVFSGKMKKDWHLYSQTTPNGGPLPLELIFSNKKGNYQTVGKAIESSTITKFNKIFGVNETYFEGVFKITQIIKIINPANSIIKVQLSYQICKDVCIPQDSYFEFNIRKAKAKQVFQIKQKN